MSRNRRNRHRHHHPAGPKVIAQGELLVTAGRGEVIIDEVLKSSNALFAHSEEVITVRFAEKEPPCPPCNPDEPDELEWDVFERRHHVRDRDDSKLYLRIIWRVACARKVRWAIYEVD